MNKFIILGFLSVIALNSYAVVYPSTSPSCTASDSLFMCINAQPEDGIVVVEKDGLTIGSASITLNKGFTLRAGIDYHPVFENTDVTINVPANKQVTFEGFEFKYGATILATVTNGSELNITSNNYTEPSNIIGNEEYIRVSSIGLTAGNQATVNIKGNNIVGRVNATNYGLLDISNNEEGTLNANIYDNHISVLDHLLGNSEAVYIFNIGSGIINCQFVANEVRGAETQFKVAQINDAGRINLGMVSNLISGIVDSDSYFFSSANHSSIKSTIGNGNFTGIFGNNTIDGVKRSGFPDDGVGFNFLSHTTTAASSIFLLNNIVVNTTDGYKGPATGTSTSVTSQGHNVFWDHGSISGLSLIATDANINPKFIQEGVNYALEPDSFAIDRRDSTGAALLYETGFMTGSPRIDADGLRRFKGEKIDAGAYEWGDKHILHINTANSTVSQPINHVELNNNADASTIVTQVWSYEGSAGVYNNNAVGIYRNASMWQIFNEPIVTLPNQAKFHVFYPYGDRNGSDDFNGLYTWQAPISSDTGFELDNFDLNDKPEAGVFVSNLWEASSSVYNESPLEIGYQNNGKWYLGTADGVNMPDGALFMTYNQDNSRNVFHHFVTNHNTIGHVTFIDHPLLNENPCALPTVTQSTAQFFGPLFEENPYNIGIYYSAGPKKWAIFNQNLEDIDLLIGGSLALGGRFNIMVDPQQVYSCNDIIFKNGFE